ncbi:hypothetical protein NG774_04085 [Aliarcobacter cryaerophilus]|uniref:hypothetical protein n=1 Tax=Aliarcobacter cryaerophilus TaxID=28198 RepID=UPI003DA622C6
MKDLKISKELLGSVMEFKKQNVYSKDLDFIRLNENNIQFAFKTEHNIQNVFSINIYEFAFKGKEWLIKNNFSYTVYYDDYFKNFRCTILSIIGYEKRETFTANTEIEAIIKACEWILENKDNK